VAFVGEEARTAKPGKDVVLAHLLEVMLIEALRSAASVGASPGLLRGLADDRLAAIRRMHEAPGRGWSVAELAREAALSRSAFFERFGREVGVAPMEYLLTWRMALAKGLLQRGGGAVARWRRWRRRSGIALPAPSAWLLRGMWGWRPHALQGKVRRALKRLHLQWRRVYSRFQIKPRAPARADR
jgi:AraC-like DNA-binding protein